MPLVLFLVFVLKVILKERIPEAGIVTYGIFLCVLGMCIFGVGLTYGLSMLGSQSGSLVPAAFTQIESVADSPLYIPIVGLFIALAFAWFLGFGATLAEPALNALGMTVQNLTNGAFKKSLLMYSVSTGVATGIAIGVCKIIFDVPLGLILVPLYILALIMTWFSTEEFVKYCHAATGTYATVPV